MDKPLDTIRWLLAAVMLLSVALYVASTLSCSGDAGLLADYLHTIRLRERINEDKTVLDQSVEAMKTIVDQLIEGQLSLPQAAAALCDEDENRPEHLRTSAHRSFVDLSKEERYMRQLLIRVENQLEDDPRREQVLKRLRKEFAGASRAPSQGTTPEVVTVRNASQKHLGR